MGEVLSVFSFLQQTPAHVGEALAKYAHVGDSAGGDIALRGSCCDRYSPVAPPSLPNTTRLELFLFEPAPANFRFLKTLFPDAVSMNAAAVQSVGRQAALQAHARRLRGSNASAAALGVRNPYIEIFHSAALGPNASPAIRFPDVPLGNELGSVGTGSSSNKCDVFVTIPSATLDRVMASPTTPFIDAVLIDTEGYDLEVVLGARGLIEEGRVGLFVFELHRRTSTRLDTIIFDVMAPNGYECFHLTGRDWQGILTPISGSCWQPAWTDIRGWYNTACFNVRLPHMRKALRSLLSCRQAAIDPGASCDFTLPANPVALPNATVDCGF